MSTEDRKKGWQARARAVRAAEERKAALLESRGWVCLPPETAEEIKALAEKAKA
jgi:hypothetical protein